LHGPEGVKKIASAIIDAMPNRQITHEDTIVKGDKVIIHWTPKKEVLGIPPSNKPIKMIGYCIGYLYLGISPFNPIIAARLKPAILCNSTAILKFIIFHHYKKLMMLSKQIKRGKMYFRFNSF
jgi:hypothetical protein